MNIFYNLLCHFCAVCDLAWHPQCMVELARFPCKIHKSKDLEEEEEDYIKFVTVST